MRDNQQLVPRSVLSAFGLVGDAVALEGGQGSSIRVGAAVLKPDCGMVETEWLAEVGHRIQHNGFRLPLPFPALDGSWVVDGWSAVEHVDGEASSEGQWHEVLGASRALHFALRHEARPSFLDERDDRWAVADRVAWDELDVKVGPGSTPLLHRLSALRQGIALDSQLIHGDLSGNVLCADGLPPAVIDVSPYWRASAYADAIVVVDALLWWDADESLVDMALPQEMTWTIWHQLLVRAAVFRLVSLDELGRVELPEMAEQLPLYHRVVSQLERRTTG
jgi:uncharacterized protein (TIGR02569 family)